MSWEKARENRPTDFHESVTGQRRCKCAAVNAAGCRDDDRDARMASQRVQSLVHVVSTAGEPHETQI